MTEQLVSTFKPLSVRDAPLRIRELSSQSLEIKTNYNLVHEMSFEEYSNYCDKLISANSDSLVSNSNLLVSLGGWQPRFDGEFILPTLRTIRNIDPQRVKKFETLESKERPLVELINDAQRLNDFKTSWVNNHSERIFEVYELNTDMEIKAEIGAVFAQQLRSLESSNLSQEMKPALKFFITNFDEFKDFLDPKILKIFFEKGFLASNSNSSDISENVDLNMSRDVFEIAKKVIQDPQSSKPLKDSAYQGLAVCNEDAADTKLKISVRNYLADRVRRYGLDSDQMLFVWSQNLDKPDNKGYSYSEFVANNFDLMDRIEIERPGICKVLYEEFGIRNFARYSFKALIEQFDTRDQDMAYGIYIGSFNDHNGSYSIDPVILDNLVVDLSHLGYMLRFYEAGKGAEVLDRFASAHERYGNKNKISYAIIAGHGNPNEIEMGRSIIINKVGKPTVKSHYFSKFDIKNGATKTQLNKWFIDKPNIILDSCSTGEKAGIGNEIYKIGADVFSPKKDTGVRGYAVGKRSNGTLWFVVDYVEDDAIAHFRQNHYMK